MLIVTAGIIIRKLTILIARRPPKSHLAGFWEFPGGKIKEGETDQECLKRELKEELGVVVNVGDLFMENQHEYREKKILLKAFFCEIIAGDIILNEHDQIKWVKKNEFHNYHFAPADIPIMEALKKKKN